MFSISCYKNIYDEIKFSQSNNFLQMSFTNQQVQVIMYLMDGSEQENWQLSMFIYKCLQCSYILIFNS